jgi:hypothetical protein
LASDSKITEIFAVPYYQRQTANHDLAVTFINTAKLNSAESTTPLTQKTVMSTTPESQNSAVSTTLQSKIFYLFCEHGHEHE